MSLPQADWNLSSSSSAAHPSFNDRSLPTFRSASQPILNQKLIPRDFLGTRSKPAPTSTLTPNTQPSAGRGLFLTNPFQNNRDLPAVKTKDTRTSNRSEPVSPTKRTAPDNRPEDNDLSALRTKSPGCVESLSPTAKARSASYGTQTSSNTDPFTNLIMPRTSSIDSAISSVSTTSLSKIAGDMRELSPTSVRNLIATAGGAENLVMHLLKDKSNVASQNAQLWKLVEKQRALIMGLNKDLERVTKERDKFKKRVRDLEIHPANEVSENRQYMSSPPNHGSLSAMNTGIGAAGQQDFVGQDPIRPMPTSDWLGNEASAYISLKQEQSDKENIPMSQPAKPILPDVYVEVPRGPVPSITKPKLDTLTVPQPTLNVIDATPLTEKSLKSFPSTRKAPPKPLNLGHGKGNGIVNDDADVQAEIIDVNEPERGRRRTRAEDDRDRELSAMKAEEEVRSRSNKKQIPKSLAIEENHAPVQMHVPAPLPTPGLPLSPRPQHAQTFVAQHLTPQVFVAPAVHLTAANVPQPNSLTERLLAAPLKSPGLPLSPRPMIRNDGQPIALSLPLSPRANMGAFPLSPRAPKHALPVPTNPAAPTDAAALHSTQSRGHQSTPQTSGLSPVDRLQVHQPIESEAPMVYRGLAVSSYPNLLLPPNALPSIQVKVHSSRLRPSRHTVIGLKSQDETTVFSLSVISRSSNSELWRIEKIPAALPQLEQLLKAHCPDLPKIPDRRFFVGQSPTLLDERRTAIDTYFDELLDIHINEQAAIAICKFLSTDVIDPEQQTKTPVSSIGEPSIQTSPSSGLSTKTGYLTKKGKNFGGWKSRFFILDGPEFRYYESSGGAHLGTIRLTNALIGRQKESEASDDGDGQYRHAFLIQEPKRKDSSSYMKHVFCAESDSERDDWVKALVYWVDGSDMSRNNSRTDTFTSASSSLTEVDSRYQNSRAGPSSKDSRDTHINTPTPTSGSSADSPATENTSPVKQGGISGPMNGSIITDSSLWGQKSQALPTREIKDKTHKMSNIFGFKRPEPAGVQQEQKPPKPRILRHNGYVRPVFGLPLAEAVEFCAPFNVEVGLPAVVYRTIEYLRFRNAANEEGLFRLSGSNVVVRNLKERFNTEGDVNLINEDEYHDVHAVASLFKTYLRELPSTLLTRDLHIEFIKVLEMESHLDKVVAFNTLVHMLPPANFALLKEMSKYLIEVTGNADKNKMSIRNVGIVFSPTLNIPTPVFTLFLAEYAAIFESETNSTSNIRTTELRAPVTLASNDIRSPRHQMFSDLPTPAYNQTAFNQNSSMIPPRGTMTGTGELGFMPLHANYETGNYVSMARNVQPVQPKPLTQVADTGGFSSLNGLLAPQNNSPDGNRKRQSGMFSSVPGL